MLHLHFANRFETLAQGLIALRAASPRGPMATETVIVPSAAVQRSLTLAIAQAEGLCANVEFDYLARWLWRQIARVVPGVAEASPFAPDVLAWRVYAALGDAAFVGAHPRLADYLGAADAVMRHELARRIATLLEQYVTYRPGWLAAWQQGLDAGLVHTDAASRADEQWQAALWRRLTAELSLGALHPVNTFVDTLRRGGVAVAAAAGVPDRAHIVALPTLAPLHLSLLQQLGHVCELHLHVVNPCREYWFELIDRRRLSHLAARGQADTHEEGHRLLAAWGKQTQSHIDLLVDAAGADADDDSRFVPHPGTTLLARLQNSILDLNPLPPASVALAADDRSVEVHVCHSLTRELEVLQDHLLGLFADAAAGRTPPLRPADVLVVTPDLEAAAPLIEALFGTAPKDRYIPFAVTGRARSTVDAPARALLSLLALVGSRFEASAVFGLLQQDVVARRFGLDGEALDRVHAAMHEAGIRWGLDAGHRASFDLPAEPLHTLADGLERLFLGYALPTRVDEPFGALLPAGDTEGADATTLGAFARYAAALNTLQRQTSAPQPPAAWGALLREALDTFVAAGPDDVDDLRDLQRQIGTLVADMARGGVDAPVPLAVVRVALEQALDDPARGGVPTGGVTFSSMSSLRNVPFEVVCAIGLNDGAFPTTTRAPEFDLMALQPQRGDRQRRDDERNLFLDLLLAARRSFYLSHCGHSVRDNAPLPPSVLVSELLELVVPAIATDPAAPRALADARRRLVIEHPLQPFSIDNFAPGGDERRRSFNRELCAALQSSLRAPSPRPLDDDADDADAAAALVDEETPDDGNDDDAADERIAPFFVAPLAAPGPEWREVSLAQLAEFFRNPCRYLLRRRLRIELPRDEAELADDEPFVAGLDARSALARRLLPHLLDGDDAVSVQRLAQAGTELPAGALGERTLARELESLSRFAERVRAATSAAHVAPHAVTLDLPLDGEPWRLHATLADLRPGGLVRWRYDELRAHDALEGWLHHLVLCAAPPPGVAPRTEWLALDTAHRWRAPEAPQTLLQSLLRLYRDGLSAPLPFFPKSAWVYMNKGQSLPAARAKWHGRDGQPGAESADAGYRLALRGQPDPIDDRFAALAEAVFGPLQDHFDDDA